MYIKEIEKDFATKFVQTYHYSQIMPRLTKYWLGLFNGDVLCGVVTLGWGTQPLQTIKKLFPEQDFITSDYLEIGKMCFLPQFNNSNFGSMALAMLVKWCKKTQTYDFFIHSQMELWASVGMFIKHPIFVILEVSKHRFIWTRKQEKKYTQEVQKHCVLKTLNGRARKRCFGSQMIFANTKA